MQSVKNRIPWVDLIKGLAIILVVVGHVVDGYADADLWGEYTLVLRGIYNFIYAFHMPLCFMISGYLYGYTYLQNDHVNTRKIKSHCIDFCSVYVLFSIFMWAFKLLMASSINKVVDIKSILFIWTVPMPTYWYFYVLVSLYLIFSISYIERFDYKIKLALFGLVSIISTCIPRTDWFQLSRIAFYGFFFLVGVEACRKSIPVKKEICVVSLGTGLIADFVLTIGGMKVDSLPVISVITAFLISYGLIGVLINHKSKSGGALQYIGKHMQEIYVTHCFVAPAIRMLLIKTHVTSIAFDLIITAIFSIVLPIILGIALKKLNIYNWVFRPYSTLKRRSLTNA